MTEKCPWNGEHRSVLRHLFTVKRLTASQIAVEMSRRYNYPFTRSAVSGKLNRLGITREGEHLLTFRTPKHRRTVRRIAAAPSPPPPPVSAPPSLYNCSITDLENKNCRFPIGDGPYMFCGDPTADVDGGVPYCPWHVNIAYSRTRKAA